MIVNMKYENAKNLCSKFDLNLVKNGHFYAIFRYRRIGRLGRIFGTEYSADFDRIFGRIFGIRSYTNLILVFLLRLRLVLL